MLARLGCEVTAFTASMEALEDFKAHPDRYDAVITDQTMPRMTGLDLARRILAVRADIPIAICTGYSDLVDEKTAKEAGVREFIMKPLNMKTLTGVLRRILN